MNSHNNARLSPATVSHILKRRGLSLLSSLESAEPRPRYERATPGEIIHFDIKKLGFFNAIGHRINGDRRGWSNQHGNCTAPGWEYVHVAIDDHSRVAFSQSKPSERKESAVEHLKAAVASHRRLGLTVERLMTDNGSCYRSKLWAKELPGTRHQTHPNEALHPTDKRQGRTLHPNRDPRVGATAFETSDQRCEELPRWLHRYNWHRPHASLGGKPPVSRLGLTGNNLLRHHI